MVSKRGLRTLRRYTYLRMQSRVSARQQTASACRTRSPHKEGTDVRMQSWLSICVEDASACGNGSRPVWGVDNVKSTVTVLEGNFTEEGVVSTEGVLFIWRIPLFVEKCVSFSRRESCLSGVGGHTLLGEGCVLTLRRGSYFAWGCGAFWSRY